MTQPPTQSRTSEQIVDEAARSIAAGVQLAPQLLFSAAGHAVRLAADEKDRTYLEVVTLIQGGYFAEAAALLMHLALERGVAEDDEPEDEPEFDDPLAPLMDPAPATRPVPPRPQPAAQFITPPPPAPQPAVPAPQQPSRVRPRSPQPAPSGGAPATTTTMPVAPPQPPATPPAAPAQPAPPVRTSGRRALRRPAPPQS